MVMVKRRFTCPDCGKEYTAEGPFCPHCAKAPSPTQGEKPGATAFSGAGAQVRREHKALEAALETYRSEKPSFAKATEDRPAEARLPVDIIANVLRADSGRTPRGILAEKAMEALDAAGYVISSPQEGATAVWADDLADRLRNLADGLCAREPHWSLDGADACREAAARIEALQRQVAASDNAHCDAELKYEAALQEIKAEQFRHGQTIARAEAAEASLRTLGDALERANWYIRCIEDNSIRTRAQREIAALTPPTRDTSCEASPSDKGADE